MSEDGTIGKAVKVLDKIADLRRPARMADLIPVCDLPKSSLYRYLKKLANQNLLDYDEQTQSYSIGVRMLGYAHVAWQIGSLAPIARPTAEGLANELSLTVHVAQLDSGFVLYVDKIARNDPLDTISGIGKIAPAYCTGIGKAMMAFQDDEAIDKLLSLQSYHPHTDNTVRNQVQLQKQLKEIREAGVAFDDEEYELGVVCIAAPILGQSGKVLGGISLTDRRRSAGVSMLGKHASTLWNAADKIATDFAAWRFPEHT